MTATLFTFEPPAPGSWTWADLDVARHETGHAVLAWSLGLEIYEARIDRPISQLHDTAGHVRIKADMDRLEPHLWEVLAGGVAERKPLRWPPNPEAAGDEGTAAMLARRLGLDRAGWEAAHQATEDFLDLPSHRRAARAVSRALLDRGALRGDEVVEICRAAERG